MDIFLIRHTAVAAAKGICYGHTDIELAPSWQHDFERLRRKLPRQALQADRVYSSPLSRCLRLAHFLREDVYIEKRLRELNFGDWENRSWDAIPAAQIQAWRADYQHTVIPNGESWSQLSARLDEFFAELRATGLQTVLLVTHGGPVLVLLARILSLPLENVFRLQIDYGSLSALKIEGDWIKISYINR